MSGFSLDFDSIIRFNAAPEVQAAQHAQENSWADMSPTANKSGTAALNAGAQDSLLEPNLWMRYHMVENFGTGMQSESSDESKSPRGPCHSLGCSSAASNLSAHSNLTASDHILPQDFDRLLSIAQSKPNLEVLLMPALLDQFVDPDRIYIDIDEQTNECVELGSSMQAQVFRAEVNDQAVAVKMSHSDSILQEYALICKLQPHPNIVRPVAFSLMGREHAPCVYMACYELAGNGDLASFLKANPRHRSDQRFLNRVACSVLAALEHVHLAGYLHSDIKPENILVMGDGTIKLADFGMCQSIHSDHMLAQGTPSYLAPEVVAEWILPQSADGSVIPPRTFTPAADIFSFGVVMSNLVLDRFPYKRLTIKLKSGQRFSPEEINEIFAVPNRCLRDIELLHPNLAAIVRLCLRQRPELRPTARELRFHFSTAFSSSTVSIV